MPVLGARWQIPLLLCLSLAACRPDPNDPQYWAKELQQTKRPQDKVRVLEDLRKSEHLSKTMLPMLHEQLATQHGPEARAAIARILGQLKDPSSVQPLIDAVDTGSSGSAGDRMNREIAQALGSLGDEKAVPVLLKLLSSRDPFLQLQAAESLGDLHSKSAVGPLLGVAQDESKEALVANRAIEALGKIRDPSVVPALIQLMFEQRGHASLYDSAKFALYQMGKPAGDALLPVLSGNAEKLQRWARAHEVTQAAIFSKSAQVLGYLLEPRAEPLLIQRLSFKTDDPQQEAFVRLTSTDSLGRLRAKSAIKPLTALLAEPELTLHAAYLRALGRIGGREAVPALVQASGQGLWELRAPALEALGLLADGHELPAVEAMMQSEGARVKQECSESPEAGLCKKQDELSHRRADVYKEQISILKVADKCSDRTSCWAEALGDTAHAGIRTRAALALGRSGEGAQVAALLKHVSDPDQEARLAALQSLDWLTRANPEGEKLAKAALPDLETQLMHDDGRSDWVEASDNLKRLVAKLKR